MDQTLEVKVTIPKDLVVVEKIEYEKLLANELLGKQWTMKELQKATGRSSYWLKENILYPYKTELDVQKGGFVKYPSHQGHTWRMSAKKMAEWLEENLERVL